MTSGETRDLPRVLAPPPVFYGGFMILGLALDRIIVLRLPSGNARWVIGVVWIVASVALLAWALRAFAKHNTSINLYRETRALITGGPFGYTRNPLYVALTMLHIGVALLFGGVWMLLLVVPALALTHWKVVLPEEHYLMSRFGAEYLDYCERVRRWV
jgi:protein-S-isoprenylcysteine O-methyltransferase Ste14